MVVVVGKVRGNKKKGGQKESSLFCPIRERERERERERSEVRMSLCFFLSGSRKKKRDMDVTEA